jgi:hypothetical protein
MQILPARSVELERFDYSATTFVVDILPLAKLDCRRSNLREVILAFPDFLITCF